MQQADRGHGAEPDGGVLLYLRDSYQGRDPEPGGELVVRRVRRHLRRQQRAVDTPRRLVARRGDGGEVPFFGELFGTGLPDARLPESQEPIEAMVPAISGVPPVWSSSARPATRHAYENGARSRVIDGSVLVSGRATTTPPTAALGLHRRQRHAYLIELIVPEDACAATPETTVATVHAWGG